MWHVLRKRHLHWRYSARSPPLQYCKDKRNCIKTVRIQPCQGGNFLFTTFMHTSMMRYTDPSISCEWKQIHLEWIFYKWFIHEPLVPQRSCDTDTNNICPTLTNNVISTDHVYSVGPTGACEPIAPTTPRKPITTSVQTLKKSHVRWRCEMEQSTRVTSIRCQSSWHMGGRWRGRKS